MNRSGNFTKFFRTALIGGLLFLLPLIVLGNLIGQLVPLTMKVVQALGENLRTKFFARNTWWHYAARTTGNHQPVTGMNRDSDRLL